MGRSLCLEIQMYSPVRMALSIVVHGLPNSLRHRLGRPSAAMVQEGGILLVVSLRVLILIFVACGVILQPLMAITPCCGGCDDVISSACSSGDTVSSRTAVMGFDTDATCCSDREPHTSLADGVTEPSPQRPSSPFDQCDCPFACCTGPHKLPIGITPSIGVGLSLHVSMEGSPEPIEAHIDSYASRLMRPPRASTLG